LTNISVNTIRILYDVSKQIKQPTDQLTMVDLTWNDNNFTVTKKAIVEGNKKKLNQYGTSKRS